MGNDYKNLLERPLPREKNPRSSIPCKGDKNPPKNPIVSLYPNNPKRGCNNSDP